ncbi:MAG: NAD(P)-dependent dehydrogenase (short-subunit alcohol dehydrogenase family) [Alphaproteobacteria bacterium]|jgi:NAD(P)-dependent dehydrogenase (short-subunit alcohol dehydrogenase family)
MKLKDKVAIITGAGRNIGEAVAHTLAGEGAKVAVVDLEKDRAEKVAADICAAGNTAKAFVADVSDEAQVQKLVKDVVAAFGSVDILLNNVAISDNQHILDISKEDWDKVLAVTLTVPFLMGKYVAKQMVAQGGGGNILNVASTSGWRGRSRAIAYTTAKGGVINLTRSMAVQLAPHKIRVNSISPNKIGSPVGKAEFDPTRPVANLAERTGVPQDMAKAVLFLVSDDSDFVWGENLFLDGGTMAMEVS